MRWTQRGFIVGAVTLLTLGGLAPTARAEGSWNGTIDRWLTGKESRTWVDRNSDGASSTVAMSGCSFPTGQTFKNVSIGLYRDNGVLPDAHIGTKTQACGTINWGRPMAGTYHFTLKKANGSTSGYRFSARSVTTRY